MFVVYLHATDFLISRTKFVLLIKNMVSVSQQQLIAGFFYNVFWRQESVIFKKGKLFDQFLLPLASESNGGAVGDNIAHKY